MFRRLYPPADPVHLDYEGRRIIAEAGDSVAAALLGAGVVHFHTTADPVSARGPWCMIGNCFDCLVEIDGEPNQQACRTRVREGMQVRMQRGLRTLHEMAGGDQ